MTGPDQSGSHHPRGETPDSEASTLHHSEAMLRGHAKGGDGERSMLGRTIGHFTIKRIIGIGGMGAVYEAMQESPRRIVALKMMRSGVTSRSALRRFQYEVQTLARLRHPGIAQIYEAGMTDDGEGGIPWFAMEYLAGSKPLTQYAIDKNLDTHQRLKLFEHVCDAAHHGHQKGIIHRDLKPGNILVTSSGDPKIIDFGVARSTDSDMAVTTLQTDVGVLIGTMQYMSPEQCAADPHDIDVRSDVYALGVVLFELLTGRPPYTIADRPIHEAARVVREDPPTRPSELVGVLRGDIETICLKALEKERDRRYQSAVELRQDIHRLLQGEPIIARRPTLRYHLKLLYRRHRTPVVLSIAMICLLVVSVIALSLLAAGQAAALKEAHRQSIRSQGIIDGVEFMLDPPSDQAEVWRSGVTHEQVLDNAAARLPAIIASVESADDAIATGKYPLVLAHNYLLIGATAKARAQAELSIDLLTDWFPLDHPAVGDSRIVAATVDFAEGHTAKGLDEGRAVINIKRDRLKASSPDTLGAAWGIADAITKAGYPDEGAQLIGELLQDMSYEQLVSSQSSKDALYFLSGAATSTVSSSLSAIVDRLAPEGNRNIPPNHIVLINNIAWQLGVTGGHPAAALDILDRLAPSLDRFQQNEKWPRFNRLYRGEMLRRIGRLDEAAALLKFQTDLDVADPSVAMEYREWAADRLAEVHHDIEVSKENLRSQDDQ
ncbi:MAG: serine/threonine protein kinase [Planctomycetes bacterium]|nr:serine/threonine protein kinase [Planctomycetota bacterium]